MSYKYKLQRRPQTGNKFLTTALLVGSSYLLSQWYVNRSLKQKEVILALDLQHSYPETKPTFSLFDNKSLSHLELLKTIEAAGKDKRVKGIIANLTEKQPISVSQAQEIREAIIKFRNGGEPANNNLALPTDATVLAKSDKAPKKFAYAYAESYDRNSNYYLASAFDKILISPAGDVSLSPLFLTQPFFKGLFDSLGILPQFARRKNYKNAVDPLTKYHFTPEFKENLETLGNGIYDEIVDGISTGRNINSEKLRKIINEGPYSAEQAQELGLIDNFTYESDIVTTVKLDWMEKTGEKPTLDAISAANRLKPRYEENKSSNNENNLTKPEDNSKSADISPIPSPSSSPSSPSNSPVSPSPLVTEKKPWYSSPFEKIYTIWTSPVIRFHKYAHGYLNEEKINTEIAIKKGAPKIALIYGLGTVQSGSGGSWAKGDEFYSSRLVKSIQQASLDPNVHSIVFRIDSGGGSYTAADTVYASLQQAKIKGKKIVISMGNVAASGGYFAAIPADSIFANSLSITGSIGVFTGKFVLNELFKSKLNINVDTLQVGGTNGGLISPFLPWTEFHWKKIEQSMDRIYGDFVARVASNRKLTLQQTEYLAQGKIFTGKQALLNGLVDKNGGIVDAIEQARSYIPEAVRGKAVVQQFPKRQTLTDLFRKSYLPEGDAEKDDQPLFDTPQSQENTAMNITQGLLNEIGINTSEINGWIQDLSSIYGNSNIQTVLKRIALQTNNPNSTNITMDIDDSAEISGELINSLINKKK